MLTFIVKCQFVHHFDDFDRPIWHRHAFTNYDDAAEYYHTEVAEASTIEHADRVYWMDVKLPDGRIVPFSYLHVTTPTPVVDNNNPFWP